MFYCISIDRKVVLTLYIRGSILITSYKLLCLSPVATCKYLSLELALFEEKIEN